MDRPDRPKRVSKNTQKWITYQIDVKFKRFEREVGILKNLEKLLTEHRNDHDYEGVCKLADQLLNHVCELRDLQSELLKLCVDGGEKSMCDELMATMMAVDGSVSANLEKAHQFLDQVQNMNTVSGAERLSERKRKSKHSVSSKSSSMMLLKMKLENEAELEETRSEAKLLEEKFARENDLAELERKLLEWQIEQKRKVCEQDEARQIAAAKVRNLEAKAEVMKDFQYQSDSSQDLSGEELENPLNPTASPFIPRNMADKVKGRKGEEPLMERFLRDASVNRTYSVKDSVAENVDPNAAAASALLEFVKHQDAPDCTITTFSGDILEFHPFIKQFEEVVERKISCPKGRLIRLIQFCTGNPRAMVEAHLDDSESDCYNNAKATLETHYGNSYRLAVEYSKGIREHPSIKHVSGQKLLEFYLFARKLLLACNRNKAVQVELNTQQNLQALVSKLPYGLQERWNRMATRQLREQEKSPLMQDFVNFLKEESDCANNPTFSSSAMNNNNERDLKSGAKQGGYRDSRFSKNKSASTNLREEKHSNSTRGHWQKKCAFCGYSNHQLNDCYKFLKLTQEERERFIGDNRLCYGCLGKTSRTHFSKTCGNRPTCNKCGRRHPSSICREGVTSRDWRAGLEPKQCEKSDNQSSVPVVGQKENIDSNAGQEQESKVKTSCVKEEASERVLMSCVAVNLCSEKTGRSERVYCFLDSLSNSTFISESVRRRLEGEGDKFESIPVVTMHGEKSISSRPCTGMSVSSLDRTVDIKLPKIFSKEHLPVDGEDIVTHEILDKWPHLQDLKSKIPDYDSEVAIGLIIGANVPRALEPVECVRGEGANNPFAVKTALGWTVCGPSKQYKANPFKMNVIGVKTCETNGNSVVLESTRERDQNLSSMMLDFFAQDFTDTRKQSELSIEDEKFLKIMESGTKFKDGHYEIPLPLRDTVNALPDNREQVLKLAMSLRKRLLNNREMREEYEKFMQSMIDRNFAERVSTDATPGVKSWYLPHHATYHPTKKKIRVVFNASKECEGMSLNQVLLAGPSQTLTNNLTGVLMRFRSGVFAYTADVEKMFYQVRVPPEQRDLLRFFWWDNSDLEGDPTEYRMCVHLFGATSSPACASYALKLSATDNQDQFCQDSVRSVTDDMYVDDLVKSLDSLPDAKRQIAEVVQICSLGGFNLTKFSGNDELLFENVPETHCEPKRTDSMVLGMLWNQVNDFLYFRELPVEARITRRIMLAGLHAVYDPLGLISPFLLAGKVILQNVTARCDPPLSWDDAVGEDESRAWINWKNDLRAVEGLKLDRCYKPKDFGEIKASELHVYADASNIGYGCGIYLKLVDCTDRISVSLVQGKSRVIPARGETIPRSELVAATMASTLGRAVQEELSTVYPNLKVTFYSDSTVVLGYIMNETKRFKIFVSNRVRKIRSNSKITEWKYCKSEDNPADYASRGLKANTVTTNHVWFTGPECLWENSVENSEPTQSNFTVDVEDPELKRQVSIRKIIATEIVDQDTSDNPVLRIVDNQSEFSKMVKRIASVIALVERSKCVKVEHLEKARLKILTGVQKSTFKQDYERLSKGLPVSGQLASLNPFMSSDGLIRVGGRVEAANVEWNVKHPIVLPKFGKIVDAIILDAHAKVKHGGRTSTMNELRSCGYWILYMNSRVKHLIHKCVKCRSLRGRFGEQRMANLPQDRLDFEAPPMTYCGVDVFGHFIVKNGRKEQKRYCVIFTDLVYRGIHIETMDSLETDSFLCALRRFVARRGNVRLLRSDNGSNFHGANNEIRKALSEMEPDIRKFLLENGGDLDWKFNVPLASHHGGVWERKIGAARRVIESVLGKHCGLLNDQSFNTLMAEVEATVNSLPLTVETLNDPNGPVPLSPANILTQKSKIVLPPPGNFSDKAELYSRRQWKRIQHLANEIWRRYQKEYLHSLQTTKKWTRNRRNFEINDIVLLRDDSVHRNHWPIGRVVDTFKDNSGFVRSVRVRLARQVLKDNVKFLERPISKIVLLLESEV